MDSCCYALQLCAMKLVQSQLQASLAAANTRSDAAALRSQRLAAALEAATAKLAATPAAKSNSPGEASNSDDAQQEQLAVEVSRLTAQAASRSQEVYRLQDQLLQTKQVHTLANQINLVCLHFLPSISLEVHL